MEHHTALAHRALRSKAVEVVRVLSHVSWREVGVHLIRAISLRLALLRAVREASVRPMWVLHVLVLEASLTVHIAEARIYLAGAVLLICES